MPLCPSCDSVYLEGVLSCPDCGVRLVDEAAMIEASYAVVEVYACGDLTEATAICTDLLMPEGVEAEVHDLTGTGDPLVPGERRIAVPGLHVDEAVAIIQAAREDGAISLDGAFLVDVGGVIEAPLY